MNVRLTYSGEQLFIALMQPPDLPTFEQSCIESRMETQDGTLDISSSSDCVDADHESQNEGSCLIKRVAGNRMVLLFTYIAHHADHDPLHTCWILLHKSESGSL